MRTTLKGALFALAAMAAVPDMAQAQADWPARDIMLVVPYSAGGATDILARKFAAELGTELGVSVLVDNRPGAGATIGTAHAAQADPDGYTLLLGQVSSHGIAPNLYETLQYDPIADFRPIVLLETLPNIVVVNKDLPINSIDELIAYGRENPGALNLASSGIGASTHLSGEMFMARTGLDMVHIPYPGSAQAVVAIMSGETDLMFDNMPSAYPHVQSGDLKALAVTSSERSPTAPDIPTVAEASTLVDLSGFSAISWFALFAPAGTSDAIIARVNETANRILDKPEFVDFLIAGGGVPGGGTPEDLARHVDAEIAGWGKVIEDAGVPKQ